MPLTTRTSCQPSRVVVEKGASRAQRLGQEFLTKSAAVMLEQEPRAPRSRRPAETTGCACAPMASGPRRCGRRWRRPAAVIRNSRRFIARRPGRDGSRRRRLGGLVKAERIHDVRAVHRHVLALSQLHGNLAIRQPVAYQLQHFQLTHVSGSASRSPFSAAGRQPGSTTVSPAATRLTAAASRDRARS